MKADDLILVGGRYSVGAFRKADGQAIWITELITGMFKFSQPFVTLVMDDTGVYAHVSNILFRLDLATGQIIWQKEIPNLGKDITSLALTGKSSSDTATAYAKELDSRRKESSSS